MKKLKRAKGLVAIMLIFCLSVPLLSNSAPAFAATSGDYEYSVNTDQLSCTITKYVGSGGEVAIPSNVDGYSVTAIGNSAFKDIKTISKLTIPNTVITIGDSGFKGMTNLTSVTIPNSVTTLGDYAFMLEENLPTLTIPNSVTTIGNQAFSNCYKLETLNLPNRLKTLGFGAFTNCWKIKTIVLPEGLTYVPNSSFMDCLALETVIIPESVTTIQGWAFHRAPAFKSLTIPKSVQTIGSAAFYDCKKLTTLYLNGSPDFDPKTFGSLPTVVIPTIYSPTLSSVSGFTCTPVTSYNVLASSEGHGVVVPSIVKGMAGEVVHITLTPDAGYSVDPTTLKYNEGSGDVLINGTSFIMPSKDITISGGFIEIPVPSVTTPSGTTTDATPTWSWNDSTGESYYRYKLNDGIWQYTAANQLTPSSELMQGAYTLSVQAMNAGGDWSNSGTSAVNVLSTVTSVVTTPSAISVQKGNTQQFGATVVGTGGPLQTVTWQVLGGVSGTQITSGGALSVAANETASMLTVKATSTQDVSKSGNTTVVLTEIPIPPPVVDSVLVSPGAATIQKGTVQNFTALVNGSNNPLQTVTWNVSGGAIGTHITGGGALTVAANETAATLTVTATSIQDVSKFGTASIMVTDIPIPPLPAVDTYPLIITSGTGGHITIGTMGQYVSGAAIEIVATPDSNYSFKGWVSTGGGSFGNAANASTTFIMPAAPTTLTAQFIYSGANSGGSGDSGGSGELDEKPQKNKADKADKTDKVGGTSAATSVTIPVYTATVSSGTATSSLAIAVDLKKGIATISLDKQQGSVIASGGKLVISVPAINGIAAYTLWVPKNYLSVSKGTGQLVFSTQYGVVSLPSNMLAGLTAAEGQQAELTISQGNKSKLTNVARDAIGERPLAGFEVKIDGKEIKWNNPNAPVEISLPYIPKEEELRKTENLVIWYIDDKGNAAAVPSGKYEKSSQAVTFKTIHFSQYGIGFKSGAFKDVPQNAWYKKAVDFIGAREIAVGSGDGRFNPEAKLTRGEFLVMLMKAYGISPAANSTGNFSDAGNTYYTPYLGAAKTLGIAHGNGNNLFTPNQAITRQEVFVMLYNLLKVMEQLPKATSEKTVENFSDAKELDSWAVEAMGALVQSGTISGNNGKLSPEEAATRAQMAQLLYNLLSK